MLLSFIARAFSSRLFPLFLYQGDTVFNDWEYDAEFHPNIIVPRRCARWCSWDGSPLAQGMMADNKHIDPAFISAVKHGRALAEPSQLVFRDPEEFLAGQLHAHLDIWAALLEGFDDDLACEVLQWLRSRVDVRNYFRYFLGPFKGEHFDSDVPPRKIFIFNIHNHLSCKRFSSFISKTNL